MAGPRVAALVLVGLATLGTTIAMAQDLRGFFNSSYGVSKSTSSEGARTEFTNDRQSLDLNWNKAVTPFLNYRLTLRGERSDSTATTNGTSSDTSTTLVQPLADFSLASPGYSLNAGMRLREQFTESSTSQTSEDLQLSERNYFLRFFYAPQDLPSASFTVDRTTLVDDRNTQDTVTTRYQASTQYALKDVTGGYSFTRFVNEDNIDRRTRTQDAHLGNLGYSSVLFGEHLALQANATASHTTTTEEFFAPGTTVVTLALRRGLSAGPDASPENSSACNPPAPCPADAVVTAPGLESGAGNVPLASMVAVGFELAAPAAVGRIEVSVAPAPPPSPPPTLPDNLGSFISFSVLFTDDPTLVTWTMLGGVSQTYDAAQSRFVLTFPATTARFFKVYVSTNSYLISVVTATGITAGNTVDVEAGDTRVSRTLTGAFSGGVAFTPVKWLTASYNLSLSGNRQEPEEVASWSGSHAANVTVQAHRLLTMSGTYQYSFSGSDQPGFLPTTTTSYALALGSVPLPTLTTSLTLSRAENHIDEELQNRSNAASLTASAKVFPKLNADSTLTVTRAEDFTVGVETFGQGASINLNAQVLPRINTVFNYSVQRQETSPAPEGQDAVAVTHAIGGGTTYTLSRVVNFTTRFDYNVAPAGTAFSQSYKIDWIPTQKASLFVSYRKTTQSAESVESGSDSITANVRWNVSRYLDLSANASYARTDTGGIVVDVQSFNVSAGFRF